MAVMLTWTGPTRTRTIKDKDQSHKDKDKTYKDSKQKRIQAQHSFFKTVSLNVFKKH